MTTTRAAPIGGKLLTPFTWLLIAVWGIGTGAGLVRFTQGLGTASAMNDGYPWGIWIAVDVVVGTGLGSGGFAIALLVYLLNRGRYHPLVRPALLTAALGYTAGATAIVFDVGRYWNLWRVPIAPLGSNGRFVYNWTSGLLEVALCVMAYTVVLWIEVAPPVLETWRDQRTGLRRTIGRATLPVFERILPVVLALGLVLPMMHQSTLGSLFLVAVTKLHKLWHTPLLPLLFLLTCVGMGYGTVVLESIFSAWSFGRRAETRMLSELTGIMSGVAAAFVVVRLGDVAARGRLGLAFSGGKGALFWLELALMAAAAAMLWRARAARDAGALLRAAGVLVGAGALYRIDVYLTAFDPGNGWRYFPSLGEILVTAGIVAVETLVYIALVRRYPFLALARRREQSATPIAASAAGGRP